MKVFWSSEIHGCEEGHCNVLDLKQVEESSGLVSGEVYTLGLVVPSERFGYRHVPHFDVKHK